MSNFDSTKKRSKNKTLNHKNPAEARWSLIQSSLESAAQDWTDFSSNTQVRTHEEVQFEKVKNMIENLKDKLNEF